MKEYRTFETQSPDRGPKAEIVSEVTTFREWLRNSNGAIKDFLSGQEKDMTSEERDALEDLKEKAKLAAKVLTAISAFYFAAEGADKLLPAGANDIAAVSAVAVGLGATISSALQGIRMLIDKIRDIRSR